MDTIKNLFFLAESRKRAIEMTRQNIAEIGA